MTTIEVVLGDITALDVDAIVTAANESLTGGGGVDGAIHRAAGPRLTDTGAAIGPCDPGDAMATPAFDLDPPVRHIIHTVGQGGVPACPAAQWTYRARKECDRLAVAMEESPVDYWRRRETG